jgi:signal transduction histidine kinase
MSELNPASISTKQSASNTNTSVFALRENRVALISGLGVTLLTIILVWYGYGLYPRGYTFQFVDLIQFVHNPFWLGYSLQTTLLPIALLYGLSQTRLFQRAISQELTRIDRIDFTAILIFFQVLAIAFEITITHSKAFGQVIGVILQAPGYVLLIPIVGGLLFGWRAGLILGVETWLIRGSYDVFFRLPPFDFYRLEDLPAMVSALSPIGIFLSGYVFNSWAFTPVWVGVIAGMTGGRMGKRKFSPVFLLGFTMILFLAAGIFTMIGRGNYAVIEWLPSTLTTALGILFVGLMIGNAQSVQAQRKAEAAELAAARAELRALRAQISPHFLFNALNTIRYFIRVNPSTARQLLLDLSQILQRSLRFEQFTSLQDELDYVRSYLALEKARFNERLKIVWNLEVDGYLDCLVPVLILQPIVENAVLHGIGPKPDGGQITISAFPENDKILVSVEDNGVGIEPEKLDKLLTPNKKSGIKESIGILNVYGRLKALYGSQSTLTIQSECGKGTHIQFTIPVSREERG